MANILVTGGASIIGSHVVDNLIEIGHQVTVLDDLSGGFVENVNPSAEFVKGSILNVHLIDDLFTSEVILNLFPIWQHTRPKV